MHRSNDRKRARHRRRVLFALRAILNDPSVMPNADRRDLVVSVSHVDFGRTVRDIYVDFYGVRKRPQEAKGYHERYLHEAKERGERTYVDLTDVAHKPGWRHIVELELQ